MITLFINDSIKFRYNKKQGLERTISWNKYRSEVTTHLQNKNLDYMINPTFRNINRLFALLFLNDSNDPVGDSFD